MTPTKTAEGQANQAAVADFAQLGAISARITNRLSNGAPAVTTGPVQAQSPAYTGAEYTAEVGVNGVTTNQIIAAALAQTDATKLAAALAALA